MTPTIEVQSVTHRYGSVEVLRELDWAVPEGAMCALLGANGAGKTTLMSIVAGMIRPSSGVVRVGGRPVETLRAADRQWLGWMAESQRLPGWMTLRELERFLEPLYDRWDAELASFLRTRFQLDPTRRLDRLSRGEHMKAALLCALAPRPGVLLMDEPFTGMDVVVKDEIVHGLIEVSSQESWTVLISSHDLAELELLADHVGFLHDGRIRITGSRDDLRARYTHVEATLAAPGAGIDLQPGWFGVARSGPRLTMIVDSGEFQPDAAAIRAHIPSSESIELRPATLRELFVALSGREAREWSNRRPEALT